MKRLITLLYIKIGGEKMYDENEWGENVRMTRRRQQKQAARKRMIMIGAAVAVFDHSRRNSGAVFSREKFVRCKKHDRNGNNDKENRCETNK